jgi:hypothetical protein
MMFWGGEALESRVLLLDFEKSKIEKSNKNYSAAQTMKAGRINAVSPRVTGRAWVLLTHSLLGGARQIKEEKRRPNPLLWGQVPYPLSFNTHRHALLP